MARELENLRISIFKEFDSQLSGTASIDWEGVPFRTDNVDEWYQPRLLGPVPTPTRLNERFETYVLNANVFVKREQLKTNIHRAEELVDAFRSAFHQATLSLQDWGAVGDPEIGHIRFTELEVNPVPGAGGLDSDTDTKQLNASVDGVVIIGG